MCACVHLCVIVCTCVSVPTSRIALVNKVLKIVLFIVRKKTTFSSKQPLIKGDYRKEFILFSFPCFVFIFVSLSVYLDAFLYIVSVSCFQILTPISLYAD